MNTENSQPAARDSFSRQCHSDTSIVEVQSTSLCIVSQALLRAPLFEGCSAHLLDTIAERAPRKEINPGEELHLGDESPLYVVEEGVLHVGVGPGPVVSMGPGTVLNTVGVLNAVGALCCCKPGRISSMRSISLSNPDFEKLIVSRSKFENEEAAQTYVVSPKCAQSRLTTLGVGEEYRKPRPPGYVGMIADTADETINLYNLCPLAPVPSKVRPALFRREVDSKLMLSVKGAPAEMAPKGRKRSSSLLGGTLIACISMELVFSVLSEGTCDIDDKDISQGEEDQPFDHFKQNCKALTDMLRALAGISRALLPCVPIEALWAMVEISDRVILEAGDVLVSECEHDEALVAIESGQAAVEKMIGDAEKLEPRDLGVLGPGAIIGDLCLIGAKVPRAATVRAITRVSALRLPASGLLRVFNRFPGVVLCVETRVKQVARTLQTSLPMRTQVLASLSLFAPCEVTFLNAMASAGERHVFYCGQVIKEEGCVDSSLYVVEYGVCSVFVAGRGQVAEIPTGNCFGERTFLGLATKTTACVRVATPLAVVLDIPQQAFTASLTRHQTEQRHFNDMKKVPDGCQMGRLVSHIHVFQTCGHSFLHDIGRYSEMRGYMPGQTIVVEGVIDSAQLFVLRGGQAILERHGRRVAEMQEGTPFGELAMLGIVRRRTATVRAVTFCFTLEIPRADFLACLDLHPGERHHFEQLAMLNVQTHAGNRWPILNNVVPRVTYHLNMYAERRILFAGDPCLMTEPLNGAAILILQGELKSLDSTGVVLETLYPGECYNEQILIGIPHQSGQRRLPTTTCEVQILSKEVWDKVMAEFPDEQDRVQRNILEGLARKAEQRLGCKLGGTGILCRSAFFRAASDQFNMDIRSRLVEKLYRPGDTITNEGEEGDCVFFVLDGVVRLGGDKEEGSSAPKFEVRPGGVFGEAAMLGIAKTYPSTLRALRHSLMHVLRGRQLKEVLADHPRERELFSMLEQEVSRYGGESLQSRLAHIPLLSRTSHDFAVLARRHAEDVFFAPGEIALLAGDPCCLGQSPIYVLLAGRAVVEGEHGVVIATLSPGEIFGEAGGLGLSERRTATVRAWSNGLVHCARLRGLSVEAACKAFPDGGEPLAEHSRLRDAANAGYLARRSTWLTEVVIPMFSNSPIFRGCDEAFIRSIAAPLNETIYKSGEVIVTGGSPADYMVMLLQGAAEVTKFNEVVGHILGGASFSEVVALGLFDMHTATVRAVQDCHVMEVSAGVIQNASERCGCNFDRLLVSRREQVERGLPISALPLHVPPDDICARAIALQAELLSLAPGEIWSPYSDSSPCGQHFGVLVRGRANLILGVEGPVVMALSPGRLLPEGVLARYGANVLAITACVGYRVRQHDMAIVIASVPRSEDWTGRFQMLQKEECRRISMKLQSARGALQRREPHRSDADIHTWKENRQRSIENAKRLRRRHSLPQVVPAQHSKRVRPPTTSPKSRVWNDDGKEACWAVVTSPPRYQCCVAGAGGQLACIRHRRPVSAPIHAKSPCSAPLHYPSPSRAGGIHESVAGRPLRPSSLARTH